MSDEQEASSGGEYVGVYRLERKLGKGGMGEVYLAYDQRLDRRVAVKRIRHREETTESDPSRSERHRERFRREARSAAKLSHPAIAQVYDVVFDQSGDSIVMEYVEGRTLGQLLAAGDIDAPGALKAAVQVAEGLAAAHGKGFVHRDLKKENVMVTPEGQAKILDFGLAKELEKDPGTESLTEHGALLGTVTSMSPEQAVGKPVDPRSDLFSLGVLLYEIFTGRSPFRRENPLRTLQSVVHEDPPPPVALRPELPPALSALIVALLQKDSGRRPASAAEVAAELRRIAGAPGLDNLVIPSAGSDRESWMSAPSDAPTGSRATGSRATGSRATGSRANGSVVTTWPGRPPPAAAADKAGSWTSTVLEAAAGRRGRWRWAVAGLAAAAVLAVLLAAFLKGGDADPELRVVVLEPEASASAAGGEIALTAFAVLEASLGTLATLEGVDAVKPSKISSSATVAQAAREVAADEALAIRLECRPSWCWVSFHRLRGSDGVTLSVGERFEVPSRSEDSLDLTRAVRRYLPELYPRYPPRSGAPRPDFRPEDYGRFLVLRKKNEAGEILGEEDLDELAAILKSSPRLLAGHLLAAGVARFLGRHEQAVGFAETARGLAPQDPRPLFQRFQIEMEMGEIERAAATLGELQRLAPGNLRVDRSRADLLAAQGKPKQAVEVARGIVDRRTSWRNILALAEYETQAGEIDVAADRLVELRALYPDHVLILSQLAGVEIRRGRFEHAAELYHQLAAIRPRGIYFHNLGWSQFLLWQYDRAASSFRRSLELEPGNAATRFNLGAALQAAGREDEALAIFRQLLQDLGAEGGRRRGIVEAECLARLGRTSEAVEIAHRLVEESQDPQVVYMAAEVFTLAGDRISALYLLGRALDRGLSPRWLANPSFHSLAGDAEFQKLLQRPRGRDPHRSAIP